MREKFIDNLIKIKITRRRFRRVLKSRRDEESNHENNYKNDHESDVQSDVNKIMK